MTSTLHIPRERPRALRWKERNRRKATMTPITDPRPIAEVLHDWIARHGGSAYAVSDGRALSARRQTVSNWLAGRPCPHEREVRALMTLIDRGEVERQ